MALKQKYIFLCLKRVEFRTMKLNKKWKIILGMIILGIWTWTICKNKVEYHFYDLFCTSKS